MGLSKLFPLCWDLIAFSMNNIVSHRRLLALQATSLVEMLLSESMRLS